MYAICITGICESVYNCKKLEACAQGIVFPSICAMVKAMTLFELQSSIEASRASGNVSREGPCQLHRPYRPVKAISLSVETSIHTHTKFLANFSVDLSLGTA